MKSEYVKAERDISYGEGLKVGEAHDKSSPIPGNGREEGAWRQRDFNSSLAIISRKQTVIRGRSGGSCIKYP